MPRIIAMTALPRSALSAILFATSGSPIERGEAPHT